MKAPGAVRCQSETLRRDTIAIARVICTFGIVYTHAWTGIGLSEIRNHGLDWTSGLYWFLVEVFSRSSVPLLSVISGWLVATSIDRRDYWGFVGEKAQGLLGPMLVWNLIAVTLVGIAVIGIGFDAQFEPTGITLANELASLTERGTFNVQTAFLRDVFICMLFAPLFVRLSNNWLWSLVVLAAAWSIGEWQLYLLLRPQILLFFLIGIVAKRSDFDLVVRRMPAVLIALAFAIASGIRIWSSMWGHDYSMAHPHFTAAFDNLIRLVAAVTFWRIAQCLARSRLLPTLKRVEPYVFLLFCSHIIILRGISPVAAKFFGAFGDPLWLAYFVLQPLVALAGTWLIAEVLRYTGPSMVRLLGGKSLESRKYPVPALAA